jgi:hypothetical protein
MRKLSSYVRKYGPIEGPRMYRRLQREAALASAHARHMKRIGKGSPRPTP